MKKSSFLCAALPLSFFLSGYANLPDVGVKISSFGYDPNDSTAFIQKAFDSGARRLILDRQSGPWVTLPLKMRSNTELVIEPGVELVAKRGEYKGLRDYLLELPYCTNVTIRGGVGSTLRMWKKDYQGPDYKHGEWRYALRIFHCENVLVEGLTIVESGGDGIGVTGKNITIRKCVCDRNHRQGISVFSAENLLIEDTVLSNTDGTAPMAGIDIEPDSNTECLVNVVVRNCTAFGNTGNGFEMYLNQLDDTSSPVDILFENCHSIGNNSSSSIHSGSSREAHFVKGKIEFRNCLFESAKRYGIFVGTASDAYDILYSNCVISNAAHDVNFSSGTYIQGNPDHIAFNNIVVYQPEDRAWFTSGSHGIGPSPSHIAGDVTLVKPDGRRETVVLDGEWARKNLPAANGGKPLPARFPMPPMEKVRVHDAAPGKLIDLPPMANVQGVKLVFFMDKPGRAQFVCRQFTPVKGRAANKSPYVITKLRDWGAKGRTWKFPSNGFKTVDVDFDAPEAGFYLFEFAKGGTRFVMDKASVPVALSVQRRGKIIAPMTGKPFSLYFFNPGGGKFAMLAGGDDYYRFRVSVSDPAGKVVASQDEVHSLFVVDGKASAPAGLWRVDFARGAKPTYDWITLDLFGVPGFYFLSGEKTWSWER